MRKKVTVFLIVQFLLSFVLIYDTNNITGSEFIPELNYSREFDSLTPHIPIYIANDDDFQSYNFTGSGNSTDPYRIESLFISTSGIGIEIKQTTVHFIIQNCGVISSDKCIFINSVATGTVSILNNDLESLENTGIAVWNGCHESIVEGNVVVAKWSALDIFNCDYSQIENNHFHNSSTGIYMEESNDCIIAGNTCYNNSGTGIIFAFSPNTIVSNNYVAYNGYEGIATDTGDSSRILSNYCAFNQYGIFAIVTYGLYVFNNTCEYNTEGLRFDGGNGADIYSNIFYRNINSGIYLSWYDSGTIRYNLLEENGYYGVVLNGSSNGVNSVYHNEFLYNTGGNSQAYDGHENAINDWYDINSNEGNTWSDIAGPLYYIDGRAGAKDPYPLNAINGTSPITTEPIVPTGFSTLTISYPYTYFIILFIPVVAGLIRKKERKE